MAVSAPSWIAVRPARTLLLAFLFGGLALGVAGGCKHRRSSLRPVYDGPATSVSVPASPCPTGTDCDPAPGGSTQIIPGPAFDDGGMRTSAPVLSAPSRKSEGGAEPRLEPEVVTPPPPPSLDAPRDLDTPPDAKFETRRVEPRTRPAGLPAKVASFVNDPNDLFQPPKVDRPWQYIVLHHSASGVGSYGEIDKLHRAKLGTDGCGYHFVIGNGSGSPDGQIEVTRRWSDQKAGAHCRDAVTPVVNDYGIGICLVGDCDREPPTARQVEAARALVAYLKDRYKIEGDRIDAHGHFAKTATVCPGKDFPIDKILGRGSMAIQTPRYEPSSRVVLRRRAS
jgi:hypothetical protein